MDHFKLVKQELSFTEEEELEIKIEDHSFDMVCILNIVIINMA